MHCLEHSQQFICGNWIIEVNDDGGLESHDLFKIKASTEVTGP